MSIKINLPVIHKVFDSYNTYKEHFYIATSTLKDSYTQYLLNTGRWSNSCHISNEEHGYYKTLDQARAILQSYGYIQYEYGANIMIEAEDGFLLLGAL